MNIIKNKKIFVIGAVFILFITYPILANTVQNDYSNEQDTNLILRISNRKDPVLKNGFRILNYDLLTKNNDLEIKFTTKTKDAEELIEKLEIIIENMEKNNNGEEKTKLYMDGIDLLKDYGFLPKDFFIDSLQDTNKEILLKYLSCSENNNKNIFLKNKFYDLLKGKNENIYPLNSNNNITQGETRLDFISVFSMAVILAEMVPLLSLNVVGDGNETCVNLTDLTIGIIIQDWIRTVDYRIC